MFGVGPMEVIAILVLLAIVFGASRLPDLGSNLGKGIKNFKNSFTEIDDDEEKKQIKEGADK